MGNYRITLGTAAALALLATPAFAATNLITNGDFETNGGTGQLDFNTSATDWTVATPPASYTFLFKAGGGGTSGTTADTTGAIGFDGALSLWGPGSTPASDNGLTLSPNGGAFIAADPAYEDGAITQSVTLVAGQRYTISFDWAAAQQFTFNGPTDAGWTVSVGGVTVGQTDAPIGNHGFSGWANQSYTFTAATSGPETVSFLAYCNPTDISGCEAAVPPFALLDSVSLTAVPEPSTWVMMALGFAGLGYVGFRRRRIAIA